MLPESEAVQRREISVTVPRATYVAAASVIICSPVFGASSGGIPDLSAGGAADATRIPISFGQKPVNLPFIARTMQEVLFLCRSDHQWRICLDVPHSQIRSKSLYG